MTNKTVTIELTPEELGELLEMADCFDWKNKDFQSVCQKLDSAKSEFITKALGESK
ncbi:hypothetical protein I2494_13310 [Budviciaceae bacterium BWR-B9]|uniref:Uncharacterized protein n=1 Tax=Limnobaculum allomyrinae TaxID=2791986 RepID=A0ABS1ISD4_9GAMM|nr:MULTISPECIES: hypothetical protein [Limnobaculum]MBK5144681.1 hypothetical protein [Limnobaculum allomyrinae]MBV7692343.1 hypothetical protein [Limnobaculum sp. M2-1]